MVPGLLFGNGVSREGKGKTMEKIKTFWVVKAERVSTHSSMAGVGTITVANFFFKECMEGSYKKDLSMAVHYNDSDTVKKSIQDKIDLCLDSYYATRYDMGGFTIQAQTDDKMGYWYSASIHSGRLTPGNVKAFSKIVGLEDIIKIIDKLKARWGQDLTMAPFDLVTGTRPDWV